ncbi:MAG: hypothetical protein ACFE9O_12200 [Promethearchaeota archaeon]
MATAGYARYEIEGHIEEVINVLEPQFGDSFTRTYEHNGRCVLAILLTDQYAFLTNSHVAVTIILRTHDYLVIMDVIGYGGSSGLIGLDWGSNKSIVHDVHRHLTKHGFKITRTQFTELSKHHDHRIKQYPRTEPILANDPDYFEPPID